MNQKGWTIIELLIVVTIIGILIAVVMTTCVGIKKREDATKVETSCEEYKDWAFEDIPARCVKYFNKE